MAAYAALVSVMHIIEQIQNHPRPPYYFDSKHAECLIEKITFLQKFLEDYSHIRYEQVDRLESRIAEAAYAAEDVIETHVVDQILAQSRQHGRSICSSDFYDDLQKVVQDMALIKNEVMEIQMTIGAVRATEHHPRSPSPAAGSSRSPPTGQYTMVGCDDALKKIMDKLTRKQHSNRQVIPIVGMGGIGKTTLAKNVYENQLIMQHFDIRAWATISQEYSVEEILSELLREKSQDCESVSILELKDRLRKSLYGQRYLIILDDMWSIDVWDTVKSLFPDNNNGSRVIITTRLSHLASHISGDCCHDMNFLNDDISWTFLCKVVFGSEDGCPLQLEEIGRKIARSCKGLPLTIVVIGGLLAKSEKLPEYWGYIAENLNLLEEREHCLNVLYMSYNYLPVHLKPCFLYMGTFAEDKVIDVKILIERWVVEGFLKPISDKRLEEVAAEYFSDLVDRNLILVEEGNRNGEIVSCKIHDLLRDLCLRESRKDKFLLVTRLHSLNNFLEGINIQRRVAIGGSLLTMNLRNFLQTLDALQSTSLLRTFICDDVKVSLSRGFRLLRVMERPDTFGSDFRFGFSFYDVSQLVNLRSFVAQEPFVESRLPSSIYLFWNLQKLIIPNFSQIKSIEIWKMPLLRFVYIMNDSSLVNPGQDDFVLGNLHTLQTARNFRCIKKVVKRIPNIKVLRIIYDKRFIGSRYCLNNLARLNKLENLACFFDEKMPPRSELVQNLTFPQSLKELTLFGCGFHSEDISTQIGSLPHLQKLHLSKKSILGPEWETIEGQFWSLKVLRISDCSDLKCWKTDDTHFPCLEQLHLEYLDELEEIPSAIGHISTLRLIKLLYCSNSVIISAKEIAEEQEELVNEDLHVEVYGVLCDYVETSASPNFKVVAFRRLQKWLQVER